MRRVCEFYDFKRWYKNFKDSHFTPIGSLSEKYADENDDDIGGEKWLTTLRPVWLLFENVGSDLVPTIFATSGKRS